MKKILLIVLLLLLWVIIKFINADSLDKKDETTIKELITQVLNGQNYLKSNNQMINKKKLLKKLPKYIIYAGKKYNKEEYIKEIAHSYQNMRNDGIKIIKYSSKIEKIECVPIENNSVDCYVKEIIKITSAPENNLSYIVEGQENIDMKFKLKRDNYKWFIEEEKIFGFEPSFSEFK